MDHSPPDYGIVIATLDRPDSLGRVLACLANQTHRPAQVVIADASGGDAITRLTDTWRARLPIERIACDIRSAAIQRNHGAALIKAPLVVFMDDDIEFPADHLAKLCAPFSSPDGETIVGVSGRETGMTHRPPGRLLRCYYRLQSGYPHEHYGASLFGAAINTVPCYERTPGPLIASPWLPSTCVAYRREVFARERFPTFAEYSYMEDVHLSARMARHGGLVFHADAPFDHHSGSSAFKRNARALARHRIANRRTVMAEVMGLHGLRAGFRLFLHRAFVTLYLLRSRPAQWHREIAGTWF